MVVIGPDPDGNWVAVGQGSVWSGLGIFAVEDTEAQAAMEGGVKAESDSRGISPPPRLRTGNPPAEQHFHPLRSGLSHRVRRRLQSGRQV